MPDPTPHYAEPARFIYRAQRQEGTTWWEVIRGYREMGDIERGTERPVIRFLPQPTADAFAHALTEAFEDGRRQGYPALQNDPFVVLPCGCVPPCEGHHED